MRWWATKPHYVDHIQPVVDALGGAERKAKGADPVIVAGFPDIPITTGPIIYMEHGAGQVYDLGLPSYAGGARRERVRLFLCPSERVAALNRAAWPKARHVVIGCPKLDPWLPAKPAPGLGVVAIAFHFNAMIAPEARSAIAHYRSNLHELTERYEVIGTAHPRIRPTAERVYRAAGIPFVTWQEVFERADVLCADNTSLGWEFIALDRPVVWMNAPWYRREVHHGLRFWDSADIQVDGPQQLPAAIDVALEERPERVAVRRRIAADIYAYRDGRSAERAAAAIQELEGSNRDG